MIIGLSDEKWEQNGKPTILRKVFTSGREPIIITSTLPNEKVQALCMQLDELQAANQELESQLGIENSNEAKLRIDAHIREMHDYNETKDVAQSLLGILAVQMQTTTKDLYSKYDLDLDD